MCFLIETYNLIKPTFIFPYFCRYYYHYLQQNDCTCTLTQKQHRNPTLTRHKIALTRSLAGRQNIIKRNYNVSKVMLKHAQKTA